MNIMMFVGCMFGGLLGIMLSFYLVLCFISWIEDVWSEITWRSKK